MIGVLRALAAGALMLLAVAVLNFLLLHAAPGDPVDVIAGESGGMSAEQQQALRAQLGLDRPLAAQLAEHLARTLRGDLGRSVYFDRPVAALIAERLPATLLLVLGAVAVAFVLGTALGLIAARRPRGPVARTIGLLMLAGYAAPVYWTGLLLMLLFAHAWPLFPVGGLRDLAAPAGTGAWQAAADMLHHAVLPVATLAIVYLPVYGRLATTSVGEALRADYVRTARAKGLGEARVIGVHALRNALSPLVTMLGLQAGNALAGAILVESVFNWPGLGRLAYESVLRRDAPVLLGLLLVSSLVVLVTNRATDALQRRIDPRIGR